MLPVKHESVGTSIKFKIENETVSFTAFYSRQPVKEDFHSEGIFNLKYNFVTNETISWKEKLHDKNLFTEGMYSYLTG